MKMAILSYKNEDVYTFYTKMKMSILSIQK